MSSFDITSRSLAATCFAAKVHNVWLAISLRPSAFTR
jgi:hypothetical protein